jgi:ribosomal-protein-alanine acetyltransferase
VTTRVRPARADDVAAVAVLEVELFEADAWSEAAVCEDLTGSRRRAVVAVDDETVVGYALLLDTGEAADLLRIGVAPSYRRQGLGGDLLDALGPSAYDRLLLEVRADDARAHGFYRARGFTEVGRRHRYYADGADAVVLELRSRRSSPETNVWPCRKPSRS